MQIIKEFTVGLLIASTLLSALLMPLVYLDFNLRKDYIAKVLCVNKDKPKLVCGGNCYLMKKLAAAKKEQQQERDSKKQKVEFVFYSKSQETHSEALKRCFSGIKTPFPIPANEGYFPLFSTDFFQPPRLV